jgi:lysophospholipase L1-like esterase
MRQMIRRILFSLLLAACFLYVRPQETVYPFSDEVQAFQKEDSIHFPPQHAILFVGSSSFRFWKDVQSYFPGHTIINRGFGGSTLVDVIHYADKIIFPYNPGEIVIYCGENDLAYSDSVTPETVVARFVKLYGMIRAHYKKIPVVFVSIKPSPSREKLLPEMLKANLRIKNFLAKRKNCHFVDVYHPMLEADGSPKKDIFIGDNLHMNEKGYAIWQKAIDPYLIKD